MSTFGVKPNTFPVKPVLDGTEELYSQTGGVNQKFLVSQVVSLANSSANLSPFSIVADFGSLPTGNDIDQNRIYVVRDFNSTGKSASFVYDPSITNWRQLKDTEVPYEEYATTSLLPTTGVEEKIYHVLDDGGGQPSVLRWDATGSQYLQLDTDNLIYEIADIAALNAIPVGNLKVGHIAIIADADGNGNRGVAWVRNDLTWSVPFIGGGSGGNNFVKISSGNRLTALGVAGEVSYSLSSGVGRITVNSLSSFQWISLVVDISSDALNGDFTLEILDQSGNFNTYDATTDNIEDIDLWTPDIEVHDIGATTINLNTAQPVTTKINGGNGEIAPSQVTWGSGLVTFTFLGSSDFGNRSRLLLKIS